MTARNPTKPAITTCRECGTITLTAWDHPRVAAITVTLDPWAITPAGETWAWKNGRTTYLLTKQGIHPRWAPGKPPRPQHRILTTHRCGWPIPAPLRAKPQPKRQTPTTTDDRIPF